VLVVREIHTTEPTHPRVVAAASDPSSSVTDVATLAPARALQSSFDELGTPLRDVTFVVVDLETTGGAPADAGITEIGAVKVRAGEVVGEFATLIDPGVPIPPFIAVLTGITDAMLADAPRLGTALPAFLEFARGPCSWPQRPYDTGFLKAACASTATLARSVVDTAQLARAALTRDEVRDCKLATLARHFRASTTPNHRALADARATVDVLHGLLEHVGAVGVHTLEELLTFSGRVTSAQRRKRFLAEGLPDTPGVYVFRDAAGRPLYVGTSRRMRTRVRSYFTASERRAWPRWSASRRASRRSSAPRRSRRRCASCASSPSTARATTGARSSPRSSPGSSSPSSPSRGCRWCARCATTSRPVRRTSARSAAAPPRSAPPRPCSRPCRCAPAGQALPRSRTGLRAAGDGPLRGPCDGSRSTTTPAWPTSRDGA
jgi:DNA polymerase III epsilon subunit family exonuclease